MVAVAVDAVVDRPRRHLEPEPPRVREQEREPAPHGAREEDEARSQRGDDEEHLDPEIRPDRVAPDREQQPHPGEHQGHRTADRPLEEDRAGDRRDLARVAAGRLEDPRGVTADRRRQHLADGVGDEVGARQPEQPF